MVGYNPTQIAVGGNRSGRGRGDEGPGGFVNPFRGRDIADRTELLLRYLPDKSLSMSDIYSAASDPNTDDDQMIEQVERTRRLARANRYAKTVTRALAGPDGDRVAGDMQREWERMSKGERRYLRQLGLEDPLLQRQKEREKKSGGGWLSDITGAAGDAADFAMRNTIGSDVGEQALLALNVPLAGVQRTRRALTHMGDRMHGEDGIEGFIGYAAKRATTAWKDPTGARLAAEEPQPTDRYDTDYLNEQEGDGVWAEITAAWDDAGAANGEGSYRDVTRKEAFRAGGRSRENYKLAYYQSIGMDASMAAMRVASEDLDLDLDDPGLQQNPRWQAEFSRLYDKTKSKRVERAYEVLNNGHMSVGRDIARSIGLEEGGSGVGDAYFHWVSGAGDFTFAVTGDPLLALGKVTRVARAARFRQQASKYAMGMDEHVARDISERATAKMATRDITDIKAYGKELNKVEWNGFVPKSRFNAQERLVISIEDAFKGGRDGQRVRALYDVGLKHQPKFVAHLIEADRRVRIMPKNLKDLEFEDVVKLSDEALSKADDDAAESLIKAAAGKVSLTGEEAKAMRYMSAGQRRQHLISRQLDQLVDADNAIFEGTTGLGSRKAILDAIDNDAGRIALAGGAWDSKRYLGAQMPHLTRSQILKNRVWARTATNVDHWRQATKLHAELMDQRQFSYFSDVDKVRFESADKFAAGAARVKALVGNSLYRISQPSSNGVVSIMGPNALLDFEKALKMGTYRDEMIETWARFAMAPTASSRRQVAYDGLDAMMQSLNIHNLSPATYKKWMGISAQRGQQYAASSGGMDIIGIGEAQQRKVALYLSQTADDVMLMPSFKVMREYAAKGDFLNAVEGKMNHALVSKLMERYWKPLMILRVGFIPRVMADEVLPWIARNGVGAPLRQWFVQPWHMHGGANTIPAILRPLANVQRIKENRHWMRDWRANVDQEMIRYTDNTNYAMNVNEWFNARGRAALRDVEQQWGRLGSTVSSRNAKHVIGTEKKGRDLFLDLPDKRWARRYAAYAPSEITWAKFIQDKMANFTRGLMRNDDMLAIEGAIHFPHVTQGQLSEVTTNKATWLEQTPTSYNLDGISATVRAGDTFYELPMRKELTQYMPHARVDRQDHMDAAANWMYELAGSPDAQAMAAALNWHVDAARATSLGHSLGLGEGVALETVRAEVAGFRYAWAGTTPRAKAMIWDMLQEPVTERKDRLMSEILERYDMTPEIRHVVEQHATIAADDLAALFADERMLYGSVSDDAVQAVGPGQVDLEYPGEPRVVPETDVVTREEFRQQYATALATLDQHAILGPMQVSRSADELAEAQATLARLQGRDSGVFDRARSTMGSPEQRAAYRTNAEAATVARFRRQGEALEDRLAPEALAGTGWEAELRDLYDTVLAGLPHNVDEIDTLRHGIDDLLLDLDNELTERSVVVADGFREVRAELDEWRDVIVRTSDDAPVIREVIIETEDDFARRLDEAWNATEANLDEAWEDEMRRWSAQTGEAPSAYPFTREEFAIRRRDEFMQSGDEVRRQFDAGAGSGYDEDQFMDALYQVHRDMGTDLVTPRKVRPSPRPGNLERRADIESIMITGDLDALDRVAQGLWDDVMTGPRNAEGVQKMERQRVTRDLRVKAPADVEGFTRVWSGRMNENDLRTAYKAVLNGEGNTDLEAVMDSFVAFRRQTDQGFDLQEWINAPVEGTATTIPIGALGSGDMDEMRRVVEQLYRLAGVEDLPEDLLASKLLSNRSALSHRLDGGAENQIVLPQTYLADSQPFVPSTYWDDPSEVLADHRAAVLADLKALLMPDGQRVNHVMAQAIASGRPTAWHASRMDPDLLPENIWGPSKVIAMDDYSFFAKVIRTGFDEIVGRPVDAMVRTPMFMHEYGPAIREAKDLFEDRLRDKELMARAEARLRQFMDEGATGEDLYVQMRSLHHEMKGYQALPDQTGGDRIMNAIAHGHEPELDVDLLFFFDERGALSENSILGRFHEKAIDRLNEAAAANRGRPGTYDAVRDSVNAELKDVQDFYVMEKRLQETIHEQAAQTALSRTAPWVDDHRLRSQFAEITRNLMPFLWAQEQTARRWIGSVAQNPVFIREMQLAMHGLRTMGVVRKDERGNDIFSYPGSEVLQEVMGRAIGSQAMVPTQVPLTGRVAYTVPFLQDAGTPSAGPLVTVPMRFIAEVMPEMAFMRNAVTPEGTENIPFFNDLMPPVLSRMIHAITSDEENDTQFAATTLQSMATMEQANIQLTLEVEERENEVNALIDEGADQERIADAMKRFRDAEAERDELGVPGPNATPAQRDAFMEKLSQVSRMMLGTKALLGFLGPTAPRPDIQNPLMDEYESLLKAMPVAEATAMFLRNNPDASPWMVFGTDTVSGAPLQRSPAVQQWMDDDLDSIERFPMAAPWLAPLAPDADYSYQAHAQQLAIGLRERIGKDEAWEEMKFREAAPAYFQMQEDFQLAVAGERDDDRRDIMEQEWAEWRDSYLQIHSVFADRLRSPAAATRRAQAKEQMRQMVRDPRTRASEQVVDVETLVEAVDSFEVEMEQYAGKSDGNTQRNKLLLRQQFLDWGDAWIERHPQLGALWRGVYRQDLDPQDLLVDTIRLRRQGILYDTDIQDAPTARAWASTVRY